MIFRREASGCGRNLPINGISLGILGGLSQQRNIEQIICKAKPLLKHRINNGNKVGGFCCDKTVPAVLKGKCLDEHNTSATGAEIPAGQIQRNINVLFSM